MDVKTALKGQIHASLKMLDQCIERCPEDLWLAGDYPRYTWRVAFHAIFFTHLGLFPTYADYKPWPGRRLGIYDRLWEEPAYVEPYELPDGAEVFTREEARLYLAYVDSVVDPLLDACDLESEDCGFEWYENQSKMSSALMNLRHIQGHVGQLSELLIQRGIDIDWAF